MGPFHPVMHLSMSCRRAGEAGHGVGIWLSLLALGYGIWLTLFSQGRGCLKLRPTWRYLTTDSDEDWDRTYVSLISFPVPRFTHALYGLERYGNHGGQGEQAKAEWISLFCLQISFVLACFWSTESLKILWYQSKRK